VANPVVAPLPIPAVAEVAPDAVQGRAAPAAAGAGTPFQLRAISRPSSVNCGGETPIDRASVDAMYAPCQTTPNPISCAPASAINATNGASGCSAPSCISSGSSARNVSTETCATLHPASGRPALPATSGALPPSSADRSGRGASERLVSLSSADPPSSPLTRLEAAPGWSVDSRHADGIPEPPLGRLRPAADRPVPPTSRPSAEPRSGEDGLPSFVAPTIRVSVVALGVHRIMERIEECPARLQADMPFARVREAVETLRAKLLWLTSHAHYDQQGANADTSTPIFENDMTDRFLATHKRKLSKRKPLEARFICNIKRAPLH
jgi:hypothetical protein